MECLGFGGYLFRIDFGIALVDSCSRCVGDVVVQVNVKLDEKLLREVERLVEEGRVRTKKEAFEKALLLLIRAEKAVELAERIDRVREGTESMRGVTEAVAEAHEEEGG